MLFAKRLVLLAVLLVGIPSATQGLQQASQATCSGSDNSVPAKCFLNGSLATALPLAYERARAIARVRNSRASCTGFLLGSEGHFMTAPECIPTPEIAANTTFEFGAESASCEDQCQVESGCPGTIVRTSAEYITSSDAYPYVLVKLAPGPDLAQYGYLQFGNRGGPGIYEQIYIPGHPGSYGKRITAYTSGTTPASIQAIYALNACRMYSLSHNAYLQPGAAGAPLLSWIDSTLSGLSTCTGCSSFGGYTSATDIRKIIGDLNGKNIKIKDVQYTGPTTPPPTTTAPLPTTTEPSPTTTTPAPTTAEPSPTTTAPPPTTDAPTPTSAEPSPTTTVPSPTTTEPSPTTTEPSPTTTEPSPTTTEPSPTTTAPPPTTTAPPPTTTAPAPPSPTTRAPYCT